jgi:hypothetical protein
MRVPRGLEQVFCRRCDVRVVYLPPYSPDYNPIEPGRGARPAPIGTIIFSSPGSLVEFAVSQPVECPRIWTRRRFECTRRFPWFRPARMD